MNPKLQRNAKSKFEGWDNANDDQIPNQLHVLKPKNIINITLNMLTLFNTAALHIN